MSTEEERAAQYCRDQLARRRAEAARRRALAGSTPAYLALLANWQPVIDVLEDVKHGNQEERRPDDTIANG